ncbi:class I SAM-dependent methyltransferase [Halobacterium zhouii]|uniref:class I SAM-dependent methyltransferase n=1 Tax=Halobacterium zhouii TaxID=2902624 RepID=UPI001E58963F|nr:methyltransferase domain-containing protein [Halobacterium zhouii]
MSVAETQAFYGRWARAYDWLCRLLPGLGGLRGAAADALALSPGDTVVDLGCGTGANLPHLRERVGSGGRVVGVDLTPGMLAEAERRVEREGWENVHLVRGDAANPPVDDVDAVLGSFVVGMLDDPASAVERWTDCLNPDGRVAVLEAGRSNHGVASGLNRAFDAFVAAGAPGDRGDASGRDDSPSRRLDANIDAARDALAANTELTRDERRVGGFVRVVAGRSTV